MTDVRQCDFCKIVRPHNGLDWYEIKTCDDRRFHNPEHMCVSCYNGVMKRA